MYSLRMFVYGGTRRKNILNGELHLANTSPKPMLLEISKVIIGIPLSVSDAGTMSRVPNWDTLSYRNPDGSYQWSISLNPGEKKTLTYSYSDCE